MGTRTTSLTLELTFAQLRALWPRELTAADAESPCPLCANATWAVYDDPLVAGEWGYCRSCRFAGDPLEWSARMLRRSIWETSLAIIEAAVIDTKSPWTPKEVGRYMHDHVAYHRRTWTFWQNSLLDLSQHGRSEWTDRQIRVFWQRCSGTEDARFGIVGATTTRQVEALFHPGSVAERLRLNRKERRTRRRGSGAGPNRIFKGPKPADLTLIPFEDVPGRISGFHFQRHEESGATAPDLFYAVPNAAGNHPVREAGLSMLSLVLAGTQKEFSDRAFIIQEPKFAADLQLQALSLHFLPLPILGSVGDERAVSEAAYRCLAPRRLIFWSPDPAQRRTCLRQCCRALGLFVDKNPQQGQFDTPYDVLYRLSAAAIPWDAALRKEMVQMSPNEAAKFLGDLQLPADEQNRFLRQSNPEFVQRLRSAEDPSPSYQRIECDGTMIVERPEGWYAADRKQPLLDGLIRIEEVHSSRDGSEVVHGRIKFGSDGQVKFEAPLPKVRNRGLIKSLNEILATDQREKLRAAKGLNAKALAIATAFQAPHRREDVGYVGIRKSRLYLRKFSIPLGGKVDDAEDPLITADAPAAEFSPPGPFTAYGIAHLGRDWPESRVFWAVAACVAHNVLAPLLWWPTRPVALLGSTAQSIGREAALLFGCRELVFAATCPPPRFIQLITEAGVRHGWPSFVGTEGMRRWQACRRAWVPAAAGSNVLVGLPEAGAARGPNTPWLFIESSESVEGLDHLKPFAPRLLTSYLHDVFVRRADVYTRDTVAIRRVLKDMAGWFQRHGGDPETVLRAGYVLGFRSQDLVLKATDRTKTKR